MITKTKRRNGRIQFIESQRQKELAFLDTDIARARQECVALLSPETMAVLTAAYGALVNAPLWERHDFWTKAAAQAALLEPSDETKAYSVVDAARRWHKARAAYTDGGPGWDGLQAYSDAELLLEAAVVSYEAVVVEVER